MQNEKAKSGPLYESIRYDEIVKPKTKSRVRFEEDDIFEETAIPSSLSKKILKLAKGQTEEAGDSDIESEGSTP